MVDRDKMSIEEILAACRRMDGEGGGSDAAAEEPAAEQAPPESQPAATESKPTPSAPPPSGKKPGEMSVQEMLAAARAEKSGGAKPAAAKPAAEKPAAAAPSGKKPGEMSVQEMLAAARAEKAGGAKPKPAAAAKPAAKAPAAKAADKAKPAAAPAAKAAPSGPKDTASILAAARKTDRPGPLSKAEAAAKAKEKPSAPAAAPAGKKALEVPPMPEKPAYARPRPAEPQQSDRRGFMAAFVGAFFGSSLAVGFSSLAVTHLLWLLGLARFMFPNILTEPPTVFKVGFPDTLAPGQVEEKYKAQFGVWIVRYEYNGAPEIYALKSVCTHLGCTPNWLEGEQKFKCPCHGSGFYKDGINFEGPAPRPLERYAIRIADDGQLEVDKSRKFQEELGQWADSASYVPV